MNSDRDPETLMRSYLQQIVVEGRLDLLEAMTQPDMVDEANAAFGGPPGRAGLVAHARGFRRDVTELRVDVKRIVAGDDEVMAWWSFTGLHSGPWLGRPPSGQRIHGSVFSFFELVDGRISRYRLFLVAEFPELVVFDTSRPGLDAAARG